MSARYVQCPASEIPPGLRWDVPHRNQGQHIEAVSDV